MFKNFTDITQVTMISHPQIVTFKKKHKSGFLQSYNKNIRDKIFNFNFCS